MKPNMKIFDSMKSQDKVIEINKLKKFYGKSRGVTDLSFEVEPGEFFGFIGPNGAGKSTTIRVLMGLIRATSGEAKIFGKDVWKDRQTTLARLGYLPSEINFYKNQSVNDVLKLAASSRWDGGKSKGWWEVIERN